MRISPYSPNYVTKTNKTPVAFASKETEKKPHATRNTVIGVVSILGVWALIDYLSDKIIDRKSEKETDKMFADLDKSLEDGLKDLDISLPKLDDEILNGIEKGVKKGAKKAAKTVK